MCLKATATAPERTHYESDEGGFHFDLDFAGTSVVSNILDLDKEPAVDGLACSSNGGEDNSTFIRIRWLSSGVPGIGPGLPPPLQARDVITGGPDWQCQVAAQGVGGALEAVAFLVEVVAVQRNATAEDPVTQVEVKPITPFQIFHGLFLNFSWYKIPEQRPAEEDGNFSDDGARRLADMPDEALEERLGLNYDSDSKRASETFEVGPLSCTNCYSRFLDIRPGVTIQSVGTWSYGLEFRVGFEWLSHLELGKGRGTSTRKAWTEIYRSRARYMNLLNMGLRSVGAPLFAWANGVTLRLSIHPMITLEHMFEDGAFDSGSNFQFVHRRAISAIASWDPTNGLTRALEVGDHKGTLQLPDYQRVPLVFGISACVGLEFTAYNHDETITDMSICPELRIGLTSPSRTPLNSQLAQVFQPATEEPDRRWCIEDITFRTDCDLDYMSRDDAYAVFCLSGMCRKTQESYSWVGNSIALPSATLCFDYVADTPNLQLFVKAMEADPIWDDTYATVTMSGGDCTRSGEWVECAMNRLCDGTYAKIKFYVSRLTLNTPQTHEQEQEQLDEHTGNDYSDGQCGAELQVSVGVHPSFGGFTIPSIGGYDPEVLIPPWQGTSVPLFGPWKIPATMPCTRTTTSTRTTAGVRTRTTTSTRTTTGVRTRTTTSTSTTMLITTATITTESIRAGEVQPGEVQPDGVRAARFSRMASHSTRASVGPTLASIATLFLSGLAQS